MFSPLCQATHSRLIAGRCPWCGRVVLEGRAFEDGPGLPLAQALGLQVTEADSPSHFESTESLLRIIEQVDHGAVQAIPLLIAALRDRHESVRAAAAQALGRIGPDAQAALPGLLVLLDDKDPLVRDAAEEAISRIQESA